MSRRFVRASSSSDVDRLLIIPSLHLGPLLAGKQTAVPLDILELSVKIDLLQPTRCTLWLVSDWLTAWPRTVLPQMPSPGTWLKCRRRSMAHCICECWS